MSNARTSLQAAGAEGGGVMRRWTPGLETDGPSYARSVRAVMDPDDDGAFVLHEDAAKLLADRDAEIERLREDLVWAVRKGVMVGHDECLRPCIWFDVHRGVEHDGTPESICRAVREARDGVS